MAGLWCLRIAGAIGLLSYALFLLSLNPFLGAAPIAGAGLSGTTPPVAVNRSLKGDRLPLFNSGVSGSADTKPAVWPAERRAPDRSPPREQMPVGCDPAFSPVSSPSLANVYGRCMV